MARRALVVRLWALPLVHLHQLVPTSYNRNGPHIMQLHRAGRHAGALQSAWAPDRLQL